MQAATRGASVRAPSPLFVRCTDGLTASGLVCVPVRSLRRVFLLAALSGSLSGCSPTVLLCRCSGIRCSVASWDPNQVNWVPYEFEFKGTVWGIKANMEKLDKGIVRFTHPLIITDVAIQSEAEWLGVQVC